MLVPVRCPKIGAAPLSDDEAHSKECVGKDCARCFFLAAFSGRVRRGACVRDAPQHAASAWRNRFVFESHGDSGGSSCWIVSRPPPWGGPWAIGCWVCNAAGMDTPFGRIEVSSSKTVQSAGMSSHQQSRSHREALAYVREHNLADRVALNELPKIELPLSGGVSGGVPRLDRWVAACQVLERSDSFADLAKSQAGVGSGLQQGMSASDCSPKVCAKIIRCLAEPLRWRDLEVLSNATCSSIAIDERASVLLLYGRVYMRKTQELYDCVLGLVRDAGTKPADCKRAIEDAVKHACSVRHGRKAVDESLANDVFERFRCSVRSAVADGGPTEQRALFESSPGALDGGGAPLFPHLIDIHRDRAHKWRSVQKGIFNNLDDDLQTFFDDLQRFIGMLQTSTKYQLLFEASGPSAFPVYVCTTFRTYTFPQRTSP